MIRSVGELLPKIIRLLFLAVFLFVLTVLLFVDRRIPLDYLSVPVPNLVLALAGLAAGAGGVLSFFAVRRAGRRHAPGGETVSGNGSVIGGKTGSDNGSVIDGETGSDNGSVTGSVPHHPASDAPEVRAHIHRFLCACVALLVLQWLVAASIWFYVGFDVGIVRISAQYALAGDTYPLAPGYFGTNPNNLGIYFITLIFLKLGSLLHTDGYLLLIAFGVWLANLAVVFTGLTVYKLTKSVPAMWTSFFWGGLLFGLSPWITVPYTDTFSILLPILTFYLYLTLRQRRMHPFWKTLFVCLPPTLGWLIKPTNAIMLIAVICTEIAHFLSSAATRDAQKNPSGTTHDAQKNLSGATRDAQEPPSGAQNLPPIFAALRRTVFPCLLALAVCLGCRFAGMAAIRSYTGIEADEANEKTWLHYAMMGANTKTIGNYNREDDAYTSSFPGKKLKNEKDWERLRERLTEMGPGGYLIHAAKKTLRNFNNGTFGWGREKSDFVELIPSEDSPRRQFFRTFIISTGKTPPTVWGTAGHIIPSTSPPCSFCG